MEEIFRLAVVRPAKKADTIVTPIEILKLIDGNYTNFINELIAAKSSNQPQQMRCLAEAYKKQSEFCKDKFEYKDSILSDLFRELKEKNFKTVDDLKQYMSDQFYKYRNEVLIVDGKIAEIIESLIALSISPSPKKKYKAIFIKYVRLRSLLDEIRSDLPSGWFAEERRKWKWFGPKQSFLKKNALDKASERLILLPKEIFPLPEQLTGKPQMKKTNTKDENIKKTKEQLKDIKSDISKLKDIPFYEVTKTGKKPTLFKDVKGIKLNEASKKAAQQMNIFLVNVTVVELVSKLRQKARELSSYIHKSLFIPTIMVPIGGEWYSQKSLLEIKSSQNEIKGNVKRFITGPLLTEEGSLQPVGFADLIVVRQIIKRYEQGEIAHIENILKGELKERVHKRLQSTEEIYTYETERTEETEKELETTDRYELQRESSRVIQQEDETKAGTEITAKYGKTLEANAYLDYSTSNSSQESNKIAQSYSKDITQRSVNRIQERVREERTTRTLHQIEEINTHRLNNENSSRHTVGIYRWVNKIYTAQMYNYGKRSMFDFMVPEPAAFLIENLAKRPPEGMTLEKPNPPLTDGEDGTFRDLTPADLTEDNYSAFIEQYHITDAPQPPEDYIFRSISLGKASNEALYEVNAPLNFEIPPGYVPKRSWTTCSGGSAFLGCQDISDEECAMEIEPKYIIS